MGTGARREYHLSALVSPHWKVEISLPKTVGARIKVDSGISSKKLDGFEKTGEREYQTSNYDLADKKIEMDLDIGITDLKINWF